MSKSTKQTTKDVKQNIKDVTELKKVKIEPKIEAKVEPKVEPKVEVKKTVDTQDSGEVKLKSKADKLKSIDKGEKANKETAFVGLEINVKPFRTWIKSYFELHGYENMRCINVHYMLATVDQIVAFSLLHDMSDGFKKTKTGMYELNTETMMDRIKLTPHLNHVFGRSIQKYDSQLDYTKQLCIAPKEFDDYINKYVFNDNFRINMNKEAMNFLKYLLVQTNVTLVNTSIIIAETANKSLNVMAVLASIKIHFTGKLLEDILKKADGIISLLKNKEKQDSEKGEDNVDAVDVNENPKSDDESESEAEAEAEEDSDDE